MTTRVDRPGSTAWDTGPVSNAPVATVQLGENNLDDVASRLKMKPEELLLANPHLQDPNKLVVGQEIRLPASQLSFPSTKTQGDVGDFAEPRGKNQSDAGTFVSEDPMNKTMAQLRMGGAQGSSALAAPAKGQTRAQWLGDLARDPGEAHRAWKNLSPGERTTVLNTMEGRYGKAFKDQFLDEVKKGRPQVEGSYYGPGLGPSPDQLKARGYKLGWIVRGNQGVQVETWVHPSGRSVQRDISTWKPGEGGATKPGGSKAPPQTTDGGKIEIGIDTTPLDEGQKKAVETLHDLENINNELNKLLNQKPIPWDDVRRNVMQANAKERELDTLMQSDNPPDMDELDPDFHDKIEDARDELTKVYDKFMEIDPGFMSHPVVDP